MKKRNAYMYVILAVMFVLYPFACEVYGDIQTPFVVQNTDGASNSVTVTYYSPDGMEADQSNSTIPGGGTLGVGPPSMPADFLGSAVVSSSRDIVVGGIINRRASKTDPLELVAGFNGISGHCTGPNVYLPLVMRNASGWNSEIVVQNVSSGPADVTIDYTGTGCTERGKLSPYGSWGVFPITNLCLPSSWVGSVVMSSNRPIAATINQTNSSTFMYDSAPWPSTRPAFPLITKISGFTVPFVVIQNVGVSATKVTVEYHDVGGSPVA